MIFQTVLDCLPEVTHLPLAQITNLINCCMQIQNLEHEIQEKQRQMRALEQLIIESGEASIANASLVEMQQVLNLHISFTARK